MIKETLYNNRSSATLMKISVELGLITIHKLLPYKELYLILLSAAQTSLKLVITVRNYYFARKPLTLISCLIERNVNCYLFLLRLYTGAEIYIGKCDRVCL